jgi:hypothetical protein
MRKELARKNRMNSSILVITYDQVLQMAKEVIRLIDSIPDSFGPKGASGS